MSFKREKIKDYYLWDTRVDNVFINEYMPEAPGDYVKVYLYALMYADIRLPMTNETIAKELGLFLEDVLKAWSYWEERGVIRKQEVSGEDRLHYKVELLNLKELVNGKRRRGKPSPLPLELQGLMNDEALRELYREIESVTGRLLTGKEPGAILSWMTDYKVTPELVVYAYAYCVKQRNNNKHNYVAAVLKEWAAQGLKTVEEAEAFLAETDHRHYLYKRVMKALGFSRNATEEEKRIMDLWFDDLGLDIDRVLEGCKKTSGIPNPNINYVNKVLKNWKSEEAEGAAHREEGKAIQVVLKEYKEKLARKEGEAEVRREEVYRKVPQIRELEAQTRELSQKIPGAMLSGEASAKKAIQKMREEAELLRGEKIYLLTENNFPPNYMDIWYDCPDCKDTGLLNTGIRCRCFVSRLEQEEKTL